MSTPLALTYRAPAAKRARRGTLLEGAGGNTGMFDPLKVVLGAIPALCANQEVRLKFSVLPSPLTNTLAEDHCCEQQD